MGKPKILDIQLDDSIIYTPFNIADIQSDAKKISKQIDDSGKPYEYWINTDDVWGGNKLIMGRIGIFNDGEIEYF